jgi:excisionase family DNA binding protein
METELLTCSELAGRLKVKDHTVKTWAKAGLIPAIRVGPKVIRFDYADVVAALRAGKDGGYGNGK